MSTFRGEAHHFLAGEEDEDQDENEAIKQMVSCSIYNLDNIYDIRNYQQD